MTIQEAVKQLKEMRDSQFMPVVFKLYLNKVIETIANEFAPTKDEIFWGYTATIDRPLADKEIVFRLRAIQKQIGGSYAIDRAIEVIEEVQELSEQHGHVAGGNKKDVTDTNVGNIEGSEMTDTELQRRKAICEVAGVNDIGDLSDGFHTFNSLYEQRMVLFAALVKAYKEKAWKSYRHEDGEYCFGGGWFVVGIDTPEGSYTYHYENKYWDMFDCVDLPRGKHWDGHTEADAETRLMSLSQKQWREVTDMSDPIERQAAIDEAEEWIETYNSGRGGQRERDAIKHVISGIKKLPSAQPEPCEYYALCGHGRDENELRARLKFCEYCNEDSDGYVKPIEKNNHAFVRFGMNGWELSLKANGWHGSAKIRYCPMCGRDLLVK